MEVGVSLPGPVSTSFDTIYTRTLYLHHPNNLRFVPRKDHERDHQLQVFVERQRQRF